MKANTFWVLPLLVVVVGIHSVSRAQQPGDGDGDGDVDLIDLAMLVDCLAGPTIGPPPPICTVFDFKTDEDVDVHDFGGFQIAFGTVPLVVFQVFAGADHPVSLGDPTVIELVGAYVDPAGCQPFQILWEWTLLSAPPGAAGFFDKPHLLGTPSDPVEFTLLEPQVAGDYVFQLSGVSPCSSASDVDSVVITVPVFSVTLDGCPQTLSATGMVTLSVSTANQVGAATFEYEVSGSGTIDATDPLMPVLTANGPSDITVTVTATDDNGTPANDSDDVTASDSCLIDVVPPPITVNAGNDRIAISSAFVSGGPIIGPTGPIAPICPVSGMAVDLVADATDVTFDDNELTYAWTLVSAPGPAIADNALIAQPNSPCTNVAITPVPTSTLPALLRNGTSSIIVGGPVPGDYAFRIMVSNPNGDPAMDEVVISYVPAFVINPPVPSPAGLSHGLQGNTNFVTRVNQAIIITERVLTSVAGAAHFLALNANGTNSAAIPGGAGGTNPDLTVGVVPVTPSALLQDIMVGFMSAASDTYNLAALWSSGVYSAGLAAITPLAFVPVNVHVQPDPLPAAVTVNPGVQVDVGVVSPDTIATALRTTVHGYRQGAGGGVEATYDGQVGRSVNLWGDSRPEIVTFNNVADVWTINGSTTLDPSLTSTSPVNNSINNDGIPGTPFVGVVTIAQTAPAGTAAPGLVSNAIFADLNGDGRPEMIVGNPTADPDAAGVLPPNTGRVLVYFHTTAAVTFGVTDPYAGVTSSPIFITDSSTTGGGDGTLFGWSIAVGNVTGDSRPDLIIGEPGWDDLGADADVGGAGAAADTLDVGRVVIIDGGSLSTAGGNVTLTLAGAGAAARFQLATLTGAADSAIGFSVGAADFNGGGTTDIIIGTPGRNHPGPDGTFGSGDDVAKVGEIRVIGGGVSGLLSEGTGVLGIWRGPVGTSTYALGLRIETGDVTDGPGAFATASDIVVRAKGSPTGTGVVVVIPDSQASGDISAAFPQRAAASGTNIFGQALAVGNFNGDAFSDILISNDDIAATAIDSVQLVFGAASISASLTANTTVNMNGVGAGKDQFSPTDAALFGAPFIDAAAGDSLTIDFLSIGDVNGDSTPDAYWSTGEVGGAPSSHALAIMGIPAPPPPPATP